MRRNDFDICADILQVARNGAKKTHLVYKANLNFKIVKSYIHKLSESGLLEYHNGRFYTSDNGKRFLDKYTGLLNFSTEKVAGDRV